MNYSPALDEQSSIAGKAHCNEALFRKYFLEKAAYPTKFKACHHRTAVASASALSIGPLAV